MAYLVDVDFGLGLALALGLRIGVDAQVLFGDDAGQKGVGAEFGPGEGGQHGRVLLGGQKRQRLDGHIATERDKGKGNGIGRDTRAVSNREKNNQCYAHT